MQAEEVHCCEEVRQDQVSKRGRRLLVPQNRCNLGDESLIAVHDHLILGSAILYSLGQVDNLHVFELLVAVVALRYQSRLREIIEIDPCLVNLDFAYCLSDVDVRRLVRRGTLPPGDSLAKSLFDMFFIQALEITLESRSLLPSHALPNVIHVAQLTKTVLRDPTALA